MLNLMVRKETARLSKVKEVNLEGVKLRKRWRLDCLVFAVLTTSK
jgi:hypothetical protein